MPLEEDEAALQLGCENVDAGDIRARQDLITARDELALPELVVTRMRYLQRGGQTACEPVVTGLVAIIDAGTLRVQAMTIHAVEMLDRRMRRKTRPDGRPC